MGILVSTDRHDQKVVAVYFRLQEGEVHRTVEITEGECYVDEDSGGNPLGIEMLVPGHTWACMRQVAERYQRPDISTMAANLQTFVAA